VRAGGDASFQYPTVLPCRDTFGIPFMHCRSISDISDAAGQIGIVVDLA
jgi:hypothetical protein